MHSEGLSSFPGLDFSEASGFDNKLYVCFSVRLNKKNKEVEIHRNNKCIQKIPMTDFPNDIDFNNIEHISSIIKIVKQDGLVGLMNKYQLK